MRTRRSSPNADANGRLKTVGFAPNFGNSWLYLFGFLNDARFMSDDGKTVTLASPKVEQALAFMQQVYDDAGGYEAVQAFQAGFQSDALDPFIQGKVAMKIDGNESLRQIAQYGRDLSFGVAAPPRPTELVNNGTVTWSGGWAAGAAEQRPAQAGRVGLRPLRQQRGGQPRAARERPAGRRGRGPGVPAEPIPQAGRERLRDGPVRHRQRRRAGEVPDGDGNVQWPAHRLAVPAGDAGRATAVERADPGDGNGVVPPQNAARVARIFAGDRAARARCHPATRTGHADPVVVTVLRRVRGHAGGVRDRRDPAIFPQPQDRPPAPPAVARRADVRGAVADRVRRLRRRADALFADHQLLRLRLLNPPRFTGLANYQTMLHGDDLLPTAIWNTAAMVIGVPLGMAVGLGLAMLLNQKARGIALWRTLFYLPAVVPMVVSSVLWVWILNPQGGLINLALEAIGVDGPRWLQSAQWSKPSLILMGLWTAGSGMIVWLAGLNGIPQSLYEAASIDGAGRWRRFVNVTLPQLTPYIFFNMLMGLIGTFQIFGQAFVMTGGGPEKQHAVLRLPPVQLRLPVRADGLRVGDGVGVVRGRARAHDAATAPLQTLGALRGSGVIRFPLPLCPTGERATR